MSVCGGWQLWQSTQAQWSENGEKSFGPATRNWRVAATWHIRSYRSSGKRFATRLTVSPDNHSDLERPEPKADPRRDAVSQLPQNTVILHGIRLGQGQAFMLKVQVGNLFVHKF